MFHHAGILGLAVPQGKRSNSRHRRRSGLWGLHVLHPDEQHVQQEELEALEALCFLSAGVSQLHDGVHQYIPPSNASSRRQQQSNQRAAGKPAKPKFPRRQQQPLKKHHVRYSPASETSSGATQCALTRLQAAELVHEIHPAALAGCELATMQQHEEQQAGKQGTESSDTMQAPDALSPMQSDDYAAQSRQYTPDVQAAASSPGSPQQVQAQEQEHHNQQQAGNSLQQQQQQQQPQVLPAAASPADQGDAVKAEHAAAINQSALQVPVAALLPPRPPSMQPLIVKPPGKGCFWHVYIARKIQADRQRQEQKQQQVQPRKSSFKRPQQQEEQGQLQQCNRQVALASAATTTAAAAAPAELPAKRRRMVQQAGRNTAAGATAADAMLASVLQAAPLQQQQQAVLQALLQQHGHAVGAPAQLQQPAPTPMQLLQAVCSATGLSVPPAAVHAPALPLSTMQLLSSLPAAATSSNQLFGGPSLSAPAARTALASQGGVCAASTAVGSVAATGSSVAPWLPAAGQFGAAGLLGPSTVPHALPRQAAAAGQQLSLLGSSAGASSGSNLLGQMMAGTWPGAAVGWQGAAPLGMLLGAAGLAPRAAAGRIAV